MGRQASRIVAGATPTDEQLGAFAPEDIPGTGAGGHDVTTGAST